MLRILVLLKSGTFDEFVNNGQAKLIVEPETSRVQEMIGGNKFDYAVQQISSAPTEDGNNIATWDFASKSKKIFMNKEAKTTI